MALPSLPACNDPQDGEGFAPRPASPQPDAAIAGLVLVWEEAGPTEEADLELSEASPPPAMPPPAPPTPGTGYLGQVLCCTAIACSLPKPSPCPIETTPVLELPVSANDGGPVDPDAYQAILLLPCTPSTAASCKTATGVCFWPTGESPLDAGVVSCLGLSLTGALQAAPGAVFFSTSDAAVGPTWQTAIEVRGNEAFLPSATPIAGGWQISSVVLPGIPHDPSFCIPTGQSCDWALGDTCCAPADRCVRGGPAEPGFEVPGVCSPN